MCLRWVAPGTKDLVCVQELYEIELCDKAFHIKLFWVSPAWARGRSEYHSYLNCNAFLPLSDILAPIWEKQSAMAMEPRCSRTLYIVNAKNWRDIFMSLLNTEIQKFLESLIYFYQYFKAWYKEYKDVPILTTLSSWLPDYFVSCVPHHSYWKWVSSKKPSNAISFHFNTEMYTFLESLKFEVTVQCVSLLWGWCNLIFVWITVLGN